MRACCISGGRFVVVLLVGCLSCLVSSTSSRNEYSSSYKNKTIQNQYYSLNQKPDTYNDYYSITDHQDLLGLSDQTNLSGINASGFLNEEFWKEKHYCATSPVKCVLLSIVFGCLILGTVVGNSFVISAVILEKNLHNVANYLIVSLAFTDLNVAVMVMPIAAYQEISSSWSLGRIICDIWTIFDVLCCTASILHLVCIALDRYWAITKLNYGTKRTPKRIGTMIATIWIIAAATALSPHVFGLSYDASINHRCQLTNNLAYQLVSTLAAFYLPLVVMCIIYWKIFQSAKFRIRKKAFSAPTNRTSTESYYNESNTRHSSSFHNKSRGTSRPGPAKSQVVDIEMRATTTKPDESTNDISNNSKDRASNEFNQTGIRNTTTTSIFPSAGTSVIAAIKTTVNESSDDNLERSLIIFTDLDSFQNDIKIIPYADSEHDLISITSEINVVKPMRPTSIMIKRDGVTDNGKKPPGTLKEKSLSFKNRVDEEKSDLETKSSVNEPSKKKSSTKSGVSYQRSSTKSGLSYQSSTKSRSVVTRMSMKKARIDMKRERKAAKTLGIIMSCFIICWLPFFIMQILFAICSDCLITQLLENSSLFMVLTWSGYFNSLLNPVIYTIFSPDFRKAFNKILHRKYRTKK